MSIVRTCLASACMGLAVLFASSAASAQAIESESSYRLFFIPQIGLGADFKAAGLDDRLTDAWTLGGQLELANASRWAPLLAYQLWNLNRACGHEPACANRGWSVEAGMTHSFLPTGVFRPYGGAVIGHRRLDGGSSYLQGRAGLDLTPNRSSVTFRIEARYHEPVTKHPGVPRLILINSGIRLALPDL